MNSLVPLSRRAWLVALLACLALAEIPWVAPAAAHEAKCAFCNLDVPQDTPYQDNEVAIRAGRKRIEYRCVYCALADAKSFQGDISILAPSEVKGRPVLLTRTAGQWTVQPPTAVFVARKVEHAQCPVAYRAFGTSAAFDEYVKQHAAVVGGAKPVGLPQLLELAK